MEFEAGSWSVDPPLLDLVFLRLVSLNQSFYGYDFQFHRVFLPSSVFPRSSDLFWSGQSGRSAVTPADGPLLLFCDADRSWRTVYSEAFLSVPGTF